MLLQQIAFGDDRWHVQLRFGSFSSLLPLMYHLVVILGACHLFDFLTLPSCTSGSIMSIPDSGLGEPAVHIRIVML